MNKNKKYLRIKRLKTLRNKYIKAHKQLIRFNKTIINELYNEDIREASEFFDCEVTLIDMLENKINIIDNKIEDIQVCNLIGLETE